MQRSHTIILVTIVMAVAILTQSVLAQTKCKSCGQNGIACMNRTAFKLCFDGIPDSTVYSCPQGKICTDTNSKCVADDGSVPPVCEQGTSGCDKCTDIKLFTCTSRTTFAQCDGTTMTEVVGKCPQGFFCDTSGSKICVSECNASSPFECDRDAAV